MVLARPHIVRLRLLGCSATGHWAGRHSALLNDCAVQLEHLRRPDRSSTTARRRSPPCSRTKSRAETVSVLNRRGAVVANGMN